MPYRTLAGLFKKNKTEEDKIELIIQKVMSISLEAWKIKRATKHTPWYAEYEQLNIFEDGELYFIEIPSVSITKDKRLKRFLQQIIEFNEKQEHIQKEGARKKRFTEIVDFLVKEI